MIPMYHLSDKYRYKIVTVRTLRRHVDKFIAAHKEWYGARKDLEYRLVAEMATTKWWQFLKKRRIIAEQSGVWAGMNAEDLRYKVALALAWQKSLEGLPRSRRVYISSFDARFLIPRRHAPVYL